MRGRRGGKTGPQNPPLGWPNAAGASPCCGALPWRGKGNALFSLYPVVPGHCEMGTLRQCPGVRLGPGAASLATRGRSRRLGVVGPGPLAPGTGHKPALLPEEHPRLKPQPNHAPLSGTWGTFLLLPKPPRALGFSRAVNHPSPCPQLPRQPPRPSPRTRNCLPPP